MTRRPSIPAVALLLAASAAACSSSSSPTTWKEFSSSANFSVTYPESWYQSGASPDHLRIASTRDGADAAMIKNGQADISVAEARAFAGKPLSAMIAYYTQDVTVQSRRELTDTAARSCTRLEEVITRQNRPEAAGSDTTRRIIYTNFFCQLGEHNIATVLRNWEDDKKQGEYQQVAARMARSIKATP